MTTPTVGMVGNLTDDPELRFSLAGKPFLRGRLSVKPYVPGATEQPEAVFYSLVCFGSLAENVAESCHKARGSSWPAISSTRRGPTVTARSTPR